MKVYSFEKLEAWKSARQLSAWVYQITKSFPKEEIFGLVSQMRRSAVSIAANLAEGTSRMSKKDQAHFSTIAYSSAVELLNHLIICKDLNLIPDDIYIEGRNKIEKQTFFIVKLKNSQQEDSNK